MVTLEPDPTGKDVDKYRICYFDGDDAENASHKYYLKVNGGSVTAGSKGDASLFCLENVGREFKIRLDGSNPSKYIAATDGSNSIQVTDNQDLQLMYSLADNGSFDEWEDPEGAQVQTRDGRYLGYSPKESLLKVYPSGTEAQAGAVLLNSIIEKN